MSLSLHVAALAKRCFRTRKREQGPTDPGLGCEGAPRLDRREPRSLEEIVERFGEQSLQFGNGIALRDDVERGAPVPARLVVGETSRGRLRANGWNAPLLEKGTRERM